MIRLLVIIFLFSSTALALPDCDGSPINSITEKRNWHNCIGTLNIAGISYTGKFENNIPNGEGKMIYADGTSFEGTFKNAKPNGYGTSFRKDGSIISQGQFENGFIVQSQSSTTKSDAQSSRNTKVDKGVELNCVNVEATQTNMGEKLESYKAATDTMNQAYQLKKELSRTWFMNGEKLGDFKKIGVVVNQRAYDEGYFIFEYLADGPNKSVELISFFRMPDNVWFMTNKKSGNHEGKLFTRVYYNICNQIIN